MGDLRDKILESFHEYDRTEIEIEPWGVTAYFRPLVNLEAQKIGRKYPTFATNPMGNIEAMVDIIIMKLEDEKGDKVFTLEDKRALMNRKMSEIVSVYQAIDAVESVEDHEKN